MLEADKFFYYIRGKFKFSKRHVWFGDSPVSTQNMSHYLRAEKPEVAHPITAWASQTGKGLLFLAKQPDQKAQPHGALNLVRYHSSIRTPRIVSNQLPSSPKPPIWQKRELLITLSRFTAISIHFKQAPCANVMVGTLQLKRP